MEKTTFLITMNKNQKAQKKVYLGLLILLIKILKKSDNIMIELKKNNFVKSSKTFKKLKKFLKN